MKLVNNNKYNFTYVENRGIFNNNEYIDTFNNFFKKIKEDIIENINKIKNHRQNKLNKTIQETINEMEELEIILSEILQLEREYHHYSSIKRISTYLLKNKLISKKNIKLIDEMHNEFFNLILSKNKFDNNQYDKIHDLFILKLYEWEEYFYLNIYSPSNNYNEKILNKIVHDFFNEGD